VAVAMKDFMILERNKEERNGVERNNKKKKKIPTKDRTTIFIVRYF